MPVDSGGLSRLCFKCTELQSELDKLFWSRGRWGGSRLGREERLGELRGKRVREGRLGSPESLELLDLSLNGFQAQIQPRRLLTRTKQVYSCFLACGPRPAQFCLQIVKSGFFQVY